MKTKDKEDQTQPSKLKPTSMIKKMATGSKAEKENKALVHLRLQGMDQISNGTPDPTLQPLEISRPTKKTKGSSTQLSKEQTLAMKRAEEVQASLPKEYPSLVKFMKHSHVVYGFWLGLPKEFCVQHLPKADTMMRLIDQCGEDSYAKYLVNKVGLSGGWGPFAIAHKLEEGDVLVFQLVKKTTFKVYIIRRDGVGEIDGTVGLPNSDTCDPVMTSSDDDGENGNGIEVQEEIGPYSPRNEDVGSDVLDWIKLLEPEESASLESFDKFSILLDGSVCINAMVPDHTRKKYYNLCTDQNSPLHENLNKGLNCGLAAGLIIQTVNISDAIRSYKCSSASVSESDLVTYDKMLQGCGRLGMNVGFLRLEVQKLMRREIEDEEKAVLEAQFEREVVVEMTMLAMRKQVEEMDEEIEAMEESIKRKRFKLKEMEASSFW